MQIRSYDAEKTYITLISDNDLILNTVTITDGDFAPDGQPPEARNLDIVVDSSTITAGIITVTGTDANNKSIAESFDLADAFTFTSTLNFKTVTNINVSGLADEDPGDTITIGVTDGAQLFEGPGILETVTVNATTGPYTIIDGTTDAGSVVAIIAGDVPKTFEYHCVIKTGLRVVMAGTGPLTVTWTL